MAIRIYYIFLLSRYPGLTKQGLLAVWCLFDALQPLTRVMATGECENILLVSHWETAHIEILEVMGV